MLVDGVVNYAFKTLKLNAAKNFINYFPNTQYYSQIKLGGAKVIFGGALPLLALP